MKVRFTEDYILSDHVIFAFSRNAEYDLPIELVATPAEVCECGHLRMDHYLGKCLSCERQGLTGIMMHQFTPEKSRFDSAIVGELYNCKLQHWNSKKVNTAILRKVKEDDCEWRFEDGAEVSYDWNVIEFTPVKAEPETGKAERSCKSCGKRVGDNIGTCCHVNVPTENYGCWQPKEKGEPVSPVEPLLAKCVVCGDVAYIGEYIPASDHPEIVEYYGACANCERSTGSTHSRESAIAKWNDMNIQPKEKGEQGKEMGIPTETQSIMSLLKHHDKRLTALEANYNRVEDLHIPFRLTELELFNTKLQQGQRK